MCMKYFLEKLERKEANNGYIIKQASALPIGSLILLSYPGRNLTWRMKDRGG